MAQVTPQLQKHRAGASEFGDCHRTCIAMILNMDRDDVPHFMHDLPPNTPTDDPASKECLRREVEWLGQHGLAPVSIPFSGEMSAEALLESLEVMTNGAPVVLGCSTPYGNHSVVAWQGRVTDPNNGGRIAPMLDGFWWVTAFAAAGNWQSRSATRELAFRAGWSACAEVVFSGDNPQRPNAVDSALLNYLQPDAAPPTVSAQETS